MNSILLHGKNLTTLNVETLSSVSGLLQTDVISLTPGSGVSHLGKAVDSASTSEDVGVAMLAVRDDELSTLVPIEGDYVNLRVNDSGALWVSGTVIAELSAVDNAVLDSIVTNTTGLATEATLATLDGKVTACDTGAVVVSSGTITAELSAVDNAVLDSIATSVTSIDTKTNSLVFGGGLEASAQRVTIASDSTGILTIDGTVTAELSAVDNAVLDSIVTNTTEVTLAALDGKVTACNTGAVVVSSGTITAELSAVDNAVLDSIVTNTTGLATEATLATLDGKVTACDTGAVVTSSGTITAKLSAVDNAVLDSIATSVTNIDTKTNSLVFGGGLEASAQRVTIASDSTGILTVDGTVTAELSAVDNAVLDSIVTNTTGLATEATLATLDGKVTACNTGAVVISSGTITAELSAVDNAVLDSIVVNTNDLGRTTIDILAAVTVPNTSVYSSNAIDIRNAKNFRVNVSTDAIATFNFYIAFSDTSGGTYCLDSTANGSMNLSLTGYVETGSTVIENNSSSYAKLVLDPTGEAGNTTWTCKVEYN